MYLLLIHRLDCYHKIPILKRIRDTAKAAYNVHSKKFSGLFHTQMQVVSFFFQLILTLELFEMTANIRPFLQNFRK